MDFLDGFVANAAFGHVDDTFERQVVGGLIYDPQIGNGIAYFGAFVKTKTTNYPIVNADLYEAVFEFTCLMLRAHEYSDAVEALAFILQRFNFFADAAGFFGTVPHTDDADLFAIVEFGPQCFAEPGAVSVDEARGRGQNMRRAAIILFKLNRLRAGEVFFKAQNVGNLCAAPRINALVIVTDAANIFAFLGEQAQPEILDGVRVLIFVDENIFKLGLIFFEDIAVVLQQVQPVQQQIAKVARV